MTVTEVLMAGGCVRLVSFGGPGLVRGLPPGQGRDLARWLFAARLQSALVVDPHHRGLVIVRAVNIPE